MLTSAPTAAVAAPAQADSEDEPSELSYLTVVVTEDDSDPDNVFTTFTITWNDAEDCSASYNAYLDGVVGDPIHLGSAASEGEQIAASLTNVSAESIGFDAKLYCGTIGSGRLVDSLMIPEYSRSFDTVPISRAYLPKPGTYSTEPGLTVLTVSSGTLTPAFHSQTLNYTVPDVANADGRITLTTTTKADYYTVAFIPGSLYFYISSCSHGGQQTSVSYQDDTGNPLYPLTDADANTPGFQMELDEGENVFKIRVWPNCESGHVYKLTVTRAANAPANTPATGAPTISGAAQVGETLTASTSGIADADGLSGATFSYQWLSSRDTEIQGATGAAYILVPGDAGKTIKVKVSFTDDEGNAETLTSAATGAVALRPNSPATGAPTIGGTAEVGETLTADTSGIADTDGLDNVSFSYQWLSSRDTAISGATGLTYTLVSTDLGKIIKVKVTFTDEAGNSETLTSAGTAAVVASANSAGICDRTAQVRDNIIGLLNAQDLGSLGIKDCSEVTEEYLTRIRFLDLASSGVGGKLTSLKSGDFEGLSGMSELNLEDNSLSKLPEGVFDGLSRLERLTMQGNDLSSLPDGVFDDLTKLHTLGLYDNDLATLPDGIFDGLTKLRTLAISGNKLTALSGDVFTGLGGLASLVASNNKLTSLPDGVFSGMSKLQSVSLSGNPSAPFTLLAELERQGEDRVVVKVSEGAPFAMTVTLSAEGGTLSATTVVIGGGDTESAAVTVTPEGAGAVTVNVDSAAFPDGGTVQEGIQTGVGESLTLEADTSGICDRTAQVRGAILEKLDYVSDCADVTAVDLSGITGHLLVWSNEALTLKSGDFAGLDNVSRMGLSQNQISILPEDVFNGLDNLKVLLLYLNQLTSLPEDIFDGLGSLEELWLSHNQLSELPEDVFDGLGNLKTLYLEGNQLSALPEDVFDGLESLESLSLGRYGYGNQLSELPEDVFDGLGSLESLKLTDNQISALPEQVFDGLDSLEELYLFSNQISTLPEDVFDGLDSLEELYLGLNQISTLPEDVFDGLGSLENLFLNYNQFSELPEDVFDGLGSLESLELTGNQISVLPEEVFDSLISLRSLGLSGNQIGVLPDDVFDGLDSLTFLNLNFNQISVLPDDVFTGLDSLTQLIISNNQIAGLPEGVFDGLSQLYRLELNGNQLSELPEGVFDGLGSLLQLWLSNNPGAPFTFTAVLEQRGDNVIRVKVAHGAPVSMSVSLSAAGGNLSDDTATVAGGSLESDAITVTATGGGAVTVSVESADFVKFPPENINGIQTGLGSPLTLGEDSDTNNPATGTPTISGTAQVGEILTADTADITDADGLTGATFSYQWLSSKDTEIVGATSFTYTLLAADEGKAMKVRVSFTDDQGNGESLTSAATDAVNASPNSPATGAPTIGGTVQVGERLTAGKSDIADADGLTKVTFTYQWLADDTAIMGATDSTYTLAAADQGKAIKVEVSFTDDAGNDETLTSAATDAVDARPNSPATGAPTISGTVQVGQTLTADTSGIADTDGLDNVSFSYQWLSSRDTAISGATGLTYTLVSTDLGKTLKVRVSFTDDGGNEETLTSAASGAVLEEPVWGDGPPGAPRNLTATPGNKEVTLSWEPPADNGNAPATRYRIEWRIDGKDYKKGHWGTSGSTTYTKTDLANGVKYVFRVKAENGSGNSYGPYGPASEEVSATPTSGSAVDLGTPVLSNTKTLHHGMVQLDWQDIEDAGWYVVQYYHVKSGEWLDLPGAGVDISFHGSSAVVSNLHGLSWLRVRAVSCAGESEWSQIEELYGTRASDWEDVPVPEVAEGDQIDPCPVTLGTPVLSGPETLHHGMVRLDWEDIEDAGWYVVQYYHVKSGEWLDLPAAGVDIAFHGSSAVASDLHGLSWLRVRAVSCAGESEWSQIEELYGTRASDWEGVTVPEVAEGDEIEPCDEDVDTPDNSPATGAPAIGGTVQVGETLTANTSGVADEDGLSNAQYEYQWLADDTDISGATASTYTLVAADEGKAIQVKVSFTDDGGNSETLTSAGTDAVLASSQADSEDESSLRSYITVVVAEDTSDPDNPQTDFTITWSDTDTCSTGYNAYLNVEPGNRPGHETPGYQLDLGSSASDGALITKSLLGVQGSVEGFNVELYCGTYGSGRLVSTVEIPMAYGRPMPETYSSEPPLNALSVSHGTLTPAFNSHTFRYAVPDVANADTRITITAIPKTGYAIDLLESSGGRVGKIIAEARRPGGPASGLSSDCRRSHSDALGQLIELTDADADTPGFQVDLYDGENHVYVSVYPIAYCILDTGYALAITRAEGSVSLPRPNRPAIGAPTISGAPLVGRTLNTHTSEIRDRDGLSNATFKYQWLADDADISEATNATYTLADADEGKAIKVEVSFTDDAGNGETLTSAATGAVDTRPNSPATGAPTITGTAQVGETLTANTSGVADADGLSNVQYEYQWLADDAEVAGATGSTYTLVADDMGKAISVSVSFTDDADNEETLTSGATEAAAARPNSLATGAPTISGTVQVGETLTANTSGIADADGLDDVSFTYQWLADDSDISGATNATYTLAAADEGKAVKVEVSFTDDADNEETLTSGATEAVAAAEPAEPPDKPRGLEATATHDSVTLTWDDPQDDSVTGYVILRRVRENDTGGEFSVLVPDTGSASTTYTDDTVVAETTYTYRIKAINGAGTSERSRWFHIDIPAAPVPDKPRGLSATATHDSVTLTWDDPGDDSITGYVILRRHRYDDPKGHFDELVADTGTADTTYTDDTVAAGTSYTYRIKAINGAGPGERSRWFHIDTPAAP